MSFRPLCPAMPPPCFILATPGREVELVVHHQDLFGLDPEEAGEHLHRLTARVHEASAAGAARPRPRARSLDLADERLELRVLAQRDAARRSEALDQPEARVVPRALVLLARVAEADDEADQGLLLVVGSSRPCSARGGLRRPALSASPFSPAACAACPWCRPFSPSAARLRLPSARRPAAVVGTSAAARPRRAAASSSSVTSDGITTVATTGFSFLRDRELDALRQLEVAHVHRVADRRGCRGRPR